MFRQSSETEYEGRSVGGSRHLFAIDSYEFFDVLDEEGKLHHFIIEHGDEEEGPAVYQTDRANMYEFMARFLAGEYEKREYDLQKSPAHGALLDALELALAAARSGQTGFSFDDLEWDDEVDDDEDEEDLELDGRNEGPDDGVR